MVKPLKLPVGIENFEEIRTGGYYYVDKTKLIKQLFASGGANYAQTECQFRYCGTAIPFLTVRSTAR